MTVGGSVGGVALRKWRRANVLEESESIHSSSGRSFPWPAGPDNVQVMNTLSPQVATETAILAETAVTLEGGGAPVTRGLIAQMDRGEITGDQAAAVVLAFCTRLSP
jgi:hypothetical protein